MNFIILFTTLFSLLSCSFKSTPESAASPASSTMEIQETTINVNQDSDGDQVTDLVEKEQGRNPLIANIPNVRVRFLQNYKIVVKYKALADGAEGDFVIDTKVHQVLHV